MASSSVPNSEQAPRGSINRCENEPLISRTQSIQTYTVDDAINKIGAGPFQVNVFLYSGSLRVIHAISDLQLALLIPSWQCEFNLTNTQLAVLTAMFPLGNIIGINPIGYLSDKYGRRNVVNIANIFLIYFSIFSAFVPSYEWLIVSRFILGVIVVATSLCTTYCVEFMPLKWRSVAVVMLSLFWTLGTCILVGLSYAIVPLLGWRYLVVITSLLMCVLPIHYFCVPPSPRFLVERGRFEEAQKVLKLGAKLNCKSLPEGDLSTDKQTPPTNYNSISHNNNNNNNNNKGLFLIFNHKYRLTTLILSVIWFSCGFLGYGTVLITSDIFTYDHHCSNHFPNTTTTQSGHCATLTPSDYLSYLVTTLGEIPGAIITVILVEIIGRKLTFVFEFFISGLTFFLLFICFPYEHTIKTVLLFIIRAANAGAFNLAFLYTGEVYPTEVRARALSFLSTQSRISTILTGFVSQIVLREYFLVAIGTFGGLAVLTAVVSLFLPLETKERKLE